MMNKEIDVENASIHADRNGLTIITKRKNSMHFYNGEVVIAFLKKKSLRKSQSSLVSSEWMGKIALFRPQAADTKGFSGVAKHLFFHRLIGSMTSPALSA